MADVWYGPCQERPSTAPAVCVSCKCCMWLCVRPLAQWEELTGFNLLPYKFLHIIMTESLEGHLGGAFRER